MNALYDTIVTPLSIDVSTGDVITPSAIKYEFGGIFDQNLRITLWGYNIETVMAEKAETILSRGVFTTRPRDYYDIYILGTTQSFDIDVFHEALKATAYHRGSLDQIKDLNTILYQIENSVELRDMWLKYQKNFTYASNITFENVLEILQKLLIKGKMN